MTVSLFDINFQNGQLKGALLASPTSVEVGDLRDGHPSFVSLRIADDRHTLVAYMPPELAEDLCGKLKDLFTSKEDKQ